MLEALRIQTVTYFLKQFFEVAVGRMMIEGDVDDAIKDSGIPERFNEWIMAVLDSEAGPQEATMPASAVMSAGYNTRMSRMAAGSRVLEANSRDVRVLVITENDFAVELHGVDNVAVVGAKVTVKDLNGNTVVTKLTEDPDVGSAVFNANEFSCDYDKEMELSVEVDASEQGYRGFYIPWLMLKRGGVYCQTLTLLTGPETQEAQSTETREAKEARALFAAEASEVKPYVYACTFNGYDILRQDKKTVISKVNVANINFELDLVHPEGKAPQAPVLHCFIEVREGRLGKMEEKTFKPTSQSTVSPTRTKYVYTNTWKRDLSPEIGKNQKPFFVLPDTGEVVNTTLQPVRAKIDQPLISGQEASNPFNSVFAKGFNLAVSIPVIGGALTVSLPFDRYLPKISVDPSGYVSITFGSSILKDPADATLWKNKEAEAYDKSMKEFQHDMSLARKKQAMGTARQYYKKNTEKTGQARVKLDFGYFMMFAGRKQADEEDDTILWSASGGTGAELVFSWEYTKPFSVCGVPMYFNIAFSASAGIAVEGLCFSFYTDGSMHLKNFEWSLVRGLSINVRLMLTVTFGIGIKGICSAWLSASGGLNVIIHIMTTQPTHIAVYGEFFLTVGFELFWIKYTRQLWRSPNWKIYSNYDMKGEANFDLFTAYAEEPDSGGVEMTELEPSRYPTLAPDAKRILTNADGVEAGIRVVELAGETLVFFVGMSTNSEGKKRRQLQWMDMATGKVEALPRNSKVEDLEDYAFDVVSDGRCIAVSACCAKQFDDNGYPKPGDIYCYTAIVTPDYNNDMPNSDYFCRGFYINKLNPLEISYNGINNPRIEALHSDIDAAASPPSSALHLTLYPAHPIGNI